MYGFHGENKLRWNKVLFKSIKCDYNILLVFENIIEHFYAIPVFFLLVCICSLVLRTHSALAGDYIESE